MLEVRNISKKYGKKTILKDISFSISPGQRVAIVGRNGCGKTTLMQILSGSMKADSGEISFFGHNPLRSRRYFREYIGYVPQDIPLLPELTVIDNLRLWRVTKCPNYKYIVERFELTPIMKTEVRKLSGGMKRRLAIACAIAAWPPILLLDEPTTALDIYYKENIQAWLSEYNNLNGMVLVSTHEEAEIVACDRCLFLKDGKLIEVEKNDEMMDNIRQLLS